MLRWHVRTGLVLGLACLGCGDDRGAPDAPVAFDYQAAISWSPTTTEIVRVAFDGAPIASGFVFEHVFAGFAAAATTAQTVDVVTTTGPRSFTLVPMPCSDLCASGFIPACDQLTEQHDDWYLWYGAPASGPLRLSSPQGSCTVDGKGYTWTH